MMPKWVGHPLRQRQAERELVSGQLIQVRVRNADVGDLPDRGRPLPPSDSTTYHAGTRASTAARTRPQVAVDRDTHLPRPSVAVEVPPVPPTGRSPAVDAGTMLSSVRCETVCRNRKTGVVNGVVMPATISIQARPYPARTAVLSPSFCTARARAEVILVQVARGFGHRRSAPHIRAAASGGLKTAVWLSTSVDGKFSDVAQARVDGRAVGHRQSSCAKCSTGNARGYESAPLQVD